MASITRAVVCRPSFFPYIMVGKTDRSDIPVTICPVPIENFLIPFLEIP